MLGKITKTAVIGLAVFVLITLGLVFSEWPPERPLPSDQSLSFAEAKAADYSALPDLETYRARDGTRLSYRRYDGGDRSLIVLLHGSGWHGMQFHEMAAALAQRRLGTVIVPDLRGHGATPLRRGDVDYIGQLEDDIADLIAGLAQAGSPAKIILGGHSSGGGLVVRFAGGPHGAEADAFLLLAPFLKYNSPTTKPNSGGWAHPATRRIVGLTMLNALGITLFNHLEVVSFAMPDEVLNGPLGHTATTAYSYRMNTSFAPRSNYTKDLAQMKQPFLLVAGADDEAFNSGMYEKEISAHTDSGEYIILPGVTHLGLVTSSIAIEAVGDWIAALPASKSER